MIKESDVEKLFIWTVAMLHGKTYKFRSVTQNGVADRIACMPDGRVWFVELKRPGVKKLDPLQHVFKNEMHQLNQNYAQLNSPLEIQQWTMTHYPNNSINF